MPYTQTTFAEAKTILANLLGDYNKVFWTDAELGRYIVEALRTWNASAEYYTDRATFNTTAGTVFYDLGTVLTPALLARTVTDTQLIADICDCLMEPVPTGLTWNGSDKFTTDDVLAAIEQARDAFLYQTTCIETEVTQTVVAPPVTGKITLANQFISDVRRVDWFSAEDNLWHHLWREDEWGFTSTRRTWSTDASMPEAFSINVVNPLEIQLSPVASNGGTLSILTVTNGPALTNSGTSLGIPNDFAWVVKWGALNILLTRDGQVRDMERGAYCAQRWKEGIALAKNFSSILQGQINGVPVLTDSIVDLDTTRPGWRNDSSVPNQLAMGSWNLLAVAGNPNGAHSIAMDVVKNAPVPVVDGDFLDLGWEYVDAIIGYAQHLAAFKMGGVEHQMTVPMIDDLYTHAMMHNAELRANAAFHDIIQERSKREMMERPAKVMPRESM